MLRRARLTSPIDDERIRAVRQIVLFWRKLAREYYDSANLLFANERYRDCLRLFQKALQCMVRAVVAIEGELSDDYSKVEDDLLKRYAGANLLKRVDLREANAAFDVLANQSEREPLRFTSDQVRSLEKSVAHVSTFFARAERFVTFCLTTTLIRKVRRGISLTILMMMLGGAASGTIWYALVNRGSGANASYYSDREFVNHVVSRIDPAIDFDFLRSGRPPGLPSKGFSVRWKAHVYAPQAGEYNFVTRADDGVRMWIDDKLVVDSWEEQQAIDRNAMLKLSKGWHTLKLEYYQYEGPAVMRLLWARPGKELSVLAGPYLKVEPK